MRRYSAFKRGRAIWILLACGAGYLIGNWNAAALRVTDLSAAQTVALRFPQDWDATAAEDSAPVTSDPQFALLSAEPMVPAAMVPAAMVPSAAIPSAAIPAAAPHATVQLASALAGPLPAAVSQQRPVRAAVQARIEAKRAQPVAEAKPSAATIHRPAGRPGFMLNDKQIASIKERLNLTPDQERMWPAVEAALRNIAYSSAREASRRGVPPSAAQVAAVDPESAEAQGLKSAAIPLIMSFNDEQKDEVRNLAHVMGLDQLASQF